MLRLGCIGVGLRYTLERGGLYTYQECENDYILL